MAVSYAPPFTVKEYLALEAAADTKHEFCGGRILAMAGAEFAHNRVAQNVAQELGNAFGDGPCQVVGSDQRVRVEAVDEYFYPDITAVCAEPILVDPRPQSLTNPQIIVEVLSESTERYDRGEKWLAYQLIPTLTDYVMASSLRREVDHYQRASDGSWTLRRITEGACTLANGVALDLARLYRLVPRLG